MIEGIIPRFCINYAQIIIFLKSPRESVLISYSYTL